MPRSRRSPSVLRLNQSPQGFRAPRVGGRPSHVGAPQNRPGEDSFGALAPQFSTLGGQQTTLTPNVQAFAPQGGPAAFGGGGGEGTALIDALASQPGPPLAETLPIAGPGQGGLAVGENPFGFPEPSPAPSPVEGYMSYLGQPTAPPESPVSGYMSYLGGGQEPSMSPEAIAAYNQNKLYRLLLEGY